jgi:hypothetical protein
MPSGLWRMWCWIGWKSFTIVLRPPIAYDHPHIAKALDTLADSYESEACRHDENAERLDWVS